jgi:hypothetical protein
MLFKSRYYFLFISLFCSISVAEVNNTNQQLGQITPTSTTIAETTYLKAKEGYTGNQLGAEVKEVSIDEGAETRLIEVHIPFDPEKVDRIQIVTESGKILKKDRVAEVLKDYENDNIGIKFYLPKQKNWVFKVKLIDDTYNQ